MATNRTQWTAFVLVACASLSCLGLDLDLSIEFTKETYLLGEPIGISIVVANTSNVDWITDELAFGDERLAYALKTEYETEEGWILIPADLLTSTPPPPPFLVMRGGELLVAGNAETIPAGGAQIISFLNLLQLIPITQMGDYRLAVRLDVPRYGETLDDEGAFIAFDDAELFVLETAHPIPFRIEIPDGVTDEDVTAFGDLRSVFNTDPAGFLERAQRIMDLSSSDHMQAVALFWIGEMHNHLGNLAEAEAAYGRILAEHPDSVFAVASSARLEEIAPN